MSPPHDVVGALLAGGGSVRMGATKAALQLQGRSFSARALAALAAVADDVVALGHGEGVPPSVQCLRDAVDDAGPLGGLLALLRSGLAERYVVVACDQPLLTAELLRPLSSAGGLAAVYARPEPDPARFEPLPLALSAAALPALERAVEGGERRLMRFIRALEPVCVRPAPGVWSRLKNVNTPQDYAALTEGSTEGSTDA